VDTKNNGDVWNLECNTEAIASDELNFLVSMAIEGNRKMQNYLRKLWDGEQWSSIKEKLNTEGSVWYVWYMDGVHKYMQEIKY